MGSKKKKFSFGGRQVLLLGLVALVIAAGYYRWTVEKGKVPNTVPAVSDAVVVNSEEEKNDAENKENSSNTEISKMRNDRDSARSRSLEEWKKITQSSDGSQEAKADAEKKIKAENDYADKERKIETQVKAKGYEDCIAYVTDGGVSVTVKGGDVDGSKVAQIKDIIVNETHISVRNIKINAI